MKCMAHRRQPTRRHLYFHHGFFLAIGYGFFLAIGYGFFLAIGYGLRTAGENLYFHHVSAYRLATVCELLEKTCTSITVSAYRLATVSEQLEKACTSITFPLTGWLRYALCFRGLDADARGAVLEL